ncbi:heavy metal response regulator transcription factor [Erwinia sp. MMLR14_017]|uniref:heavy metal response regulator transcription factor n=1 Tax=Erwinia sp. MMLR14_017 TaxID=3093842 RepID=UPI0029906BBA|nr:heavy metal response regulator transcription factor [Erwinia sp. MMLR14_017]MDW8845050.1 heavy metal response regulator transcription factor [Erwinia sp. MMLR14_017]
MKILIVEDEDKARDYMRKGLTEAGFIVDTAENGQDGLFYATEHHYDLILLDVMLPEMDGWQVMAAMNKQIHTPVIFLTAKGTVEDRIKGLELGADDYLVKPFSFAELLARVRTQLRRGSQQKLPDTLTLADLQLDIIKRRVERGGERIDLTNKEFNLLHLFLLHPGEVLTRTLIASRVWDMNFDSDTNVVDVAVKRLRQKIDAPFAQPLIHTVHGVGYRCEAER